MDLIVCCPKKAFELNHSLSFQIVASNAFYWMKICAFEGLHLQLFFGVCLINNHWLSFTLNKQQSIIQSYSTIHCSNNDLVCQLFQAQKLQCCFTYLGIPIIKIRHHNLDNVTYILGRSWYRSRSHVFNLCARCQYWEDHLARKDWDVH